MFPAPKELTHRVPTEISHCEVPRVVRRGRNCGNAPVEPVKNHLCDLLGWDRMQKFSTGEILQKLEWSKKHSKFQEILGDFYNITEVCRLSARCFFAGLPATCIVAGVFILQTAAIFGAISGPSKLLIGTRELLALGVGLFKAKIIKNSCVKKAQCC